MASFTIPRILVFRAQEINFTPPPSEQYPNPSPILMTKIHYLDDFEGAGREQQQQNLGKQVFKANADVSLFHKLKGQKIPGYFDVDFLQTADSKTGKPMLRIKDMRPTTPGSDTQEQGPNK